MHRLAVAGLLPVLFVASAAAQKSPTAPGAIVTEAEFLSVLDESHPAVAETTETLAVAKARILAASVLENPVFGIGFEDPTGPGGSDGSMEQIEWTLSWQLPGWDRRSRIAAREAEADAASARLTHRLLSLRLIMKKIYSDWAFASARLECLSGQVERVEALADREILRAKRGEASGLEARRLDLAASWLRTQVALASAGVDQTRARAASWSPELPPDGRPVLPSLPATPELGDDHPLVRAAAKDLAAATLEREVAGRFVASPKVLLGWQQQKAGQESIDGPLLGLAWSVPVFDRKHAERATSEARVFGASARLRRVQTEVESARSGTLASFQDLALALVNARAALDGNERMLTGIEAAFRHGEVGVTDLLETHRSVTESELAVLELHEAALAAHRELERLAGYAVPLGNLPSQPSESNPQEDLP